MLRLKLACFVVQMSVSMLKFTRQTFGYPVSACIQKVGSRPSKYPRICGQLARLSLSLMRRQSTKTSNATQGVAYQNDAEKVFYNVVSIVSSI